MNTMISKNDVVLFFKKIFSEGLRSCEKVGVYLWFYNLGKICHAREYICYYWILRLILIY
jgi:hypothetical protein